MPKLKAFKNMTLVHFWEMATLCSTYSAILMCPSLSKRMLSSFKSLKNTAEKIWSRDNRRKILPVDDSFVMQIEETNSDFGRIETRMTEIGIPWLFQIGHLSSPCVVSVRHFDELIRIRTCWVTLCWFVLDHVFSQYSQVLTTYVVTCLLIISKSVTSIIPNNEFLRERERASRLSRQ